MTKNLFISVAGVNYDQSQQKDDKFIFILRSLLLCYKHFIVMRNLDQEFHLSLLLLINILSANANNKYKNNNKKGRNATGDNGKKK